MNVTDKSWRRIETLDDLFKADTARTEARLPENWITVACRQIRSRPWYASMPVNELEPRLKSLPWWYSLLQEERPRCTEKQRAARASNMQRAREAKARYRAPYQAPCVAASAEQTV